jgi:NADH-quinone oxidoreductase subunit J
MMKDIIFYLLAAFILVNGMLAVSSKKIFRSAIYLLFSLIGIAGLFFWMEYEFVAAVQIVVYVGGIVVLIIFSIFLTQQTGTDLPEPKFSRNTAAAIASLCGFAFTLMQIYRFGFPPVKHSPPPAVADIGTRMLNLNESGMALPFEVISILLLAAMIACIVIAIKNRTENA